ncbi:MAG TPA: signal peptidase II [candidate division Zixibacteria bacterium]|nr:signal peptidase II [candidate division Zixibacteria bacterium]
MTEKPRFPIFGIPLLIILVALDQLSKHIVMQNLRLYEGIPVLGHYFRISYVLNPGGAFSTSFGGASFYIIVGSIATAMVILYIVFSRERNRAMQLSLFAILSGAVGNLIDRIRFGQVVDWIDVGIGSTRWPTFNIADSAIVVGLIILIFAGSKSERENRKDKGSEGDEADEAGHISGNVGAGSEPEPDSETDSR